ncbi:MAG: AraC family transcriptional regulator [Sphingobacteriales bacterium]|nr:AraC family transcriptional regulator [Sphingobacteriales bacterium]
MKATLKKVTPNPEQSFSIRKDIGQNMLNDWHYHPECELLYIKRSSGTCLIGDFIGHFQSGDTILFGSNLPHTFRHEYEYIEKRDETAGESVVILFMRETFGSAFLNLPEIKEIVKLLNIANLGLKLQGETRKLVAEIADKMLNVSPSKRLIYLLSALEIIATTKEYTILSSNGFTNGCNTSDGDRMKVIFDYTFNNYHNKITLEEVATLLKMAKHSFCRYFRSKTKKTYVQFLMEVRIGHACRLLVEEDLNVAEVSYSCGYNNISHLYHQFKAITSKKPLEYKNDYLNSRV